MKLTHLILFSLVMMTFTGIKIKILKKAVQNSQTTNASSGPMLGGFQIKQDCEDLAPGISGADLFSVYSEQLMSIFQDNINELRLVKHEYQVVAGMNHRLIFRVRDLQTNDKLYYGFGVFVDLQGGVRITAYRESFDLNEIVSALGFSDNKLYGYPCGKINDLAVKGFETWASGIVKCPAVQPIPQPQTQFDNLHSFGNPVPTPTFQNQNPAPASFNSVPEQSYNPVNFTPQSTQQPVQTSPAVSTQPAFGNGEDSPFTTINLKIKTTDSNGNPIIIGSKRPPKKKSD